MISRTAPETAPSILSVRWSRRHKLGKVLPSHALGISQALRLRSQEVANRRFDRRQHRRRHVPNTMASSPLGSSPKKNGPDDMNASTAPQSRNADSTISSSE